MCARLLHSYGLKVSDFDSLFFEQAADLLAEGGVMFLGLQDEKDILHTRIKDSIIRL